MKYVLPVIVFFIALFLYTKLAGPLPFYINSVQTTKTNLFQVEGSGQVSAAPDEATISFSVTKSANTIGDAQNQTNTAISKILDSLKNLRIDAKDIKTTDYNASPNYDYTSNNQQITGYTVTQSVDVKITSLDKVNKTLDTLTAQGANVIGKVSFGFSDTLEQKLEDQARVMAVTQAEDKAQSLANAAGIHLGQIVDVIENAPTTAQSVPLLRAVAEPQSNSIFSQVTPGQNAISTTVTLSYQTY